MGVFSPRRAAYSVGIREHVLLCAVHKTTLLKPAAIASRRCCLAAESVELSQPHTSLQ